MPPIDPTSGLSGARPLREATQARGEALLRLATAQRINRAADDPAGLSTSESLKARLAALEAETRASERARAIAQTADGALSALSDVLVDARAAAVAAANSAGASDAEREAYDMEMRAARDAADRIASAAEFNGQKLFDGSFTIAIKDARLDLPAVYATDLGIDGQPPPEEAPAALDGAIDRIAAARGAIGMFDRETASITRAALVEIENVSAANSQIADTDYASESAREVRAAVLQQSSILVLSGVNQSGPRLTDLLG